MTQLKITQPVGNINKAPDQNSRVIDGSLLASFGHLRTANSFTLFDSKTIHDKCPLLWDEDLNGSATSTHNETDACCNMVVSSAADYAIRQTKMAFNYQPGKGQFIAMTASKFNPELNVSKAIGYMTSGFTDPHNITNGLYFGSSDGYVSVNVAKAGGIRCFPQSQWNLDTMNGAGPSRVNIDWTQAQIFVIDFQWLGVGRVRFGLDLDGTLFYVHEVLHANNFDSVYMSSPNLHLRYELRSSGGAGSLDTICSTISSEGGQDPNGVIRTHSTGNAYTTLTTAGQPYAVIGIQLSQTDGYSDGSVLPVALSMLAETNDMYHWYLCMNPIVSGAFNYNPIIYESVCLGAIGNNNPVGPGDLGIIVLEGYGSAALSQTINIPNAVRIGHTIDGQMDSLVLVVTPVSANCHFNAALCWREL